MIYTCSISFILILFFLPPLYAADFSDASQEHLIRGVYHLINQNDLDAAASEFRHAIALDQHNSEAYYFLGRTYYEQSTPKVDTSIKSKRRPRLTESQLHQTIGRAKALLLRAQKLGVIYDKLHPDLLSQLEQEYPKVAPVYEERLLPKKAKIIIEMKEPSYEIRVLKMNERDANLSFGRNSSFVSETNVNESIGSSLLGTFLSETEIQLEGGTSYQIELSPQKPKRIKHLIPIAIGLAIWFIR